MLVTALTTSFHHPTAAAQHPLPTIGQPFNPDDPPATAAPTTQAPIHHAFTSHRPSTTHTGAHRHSPHSHYTHSTTGQRILPTPFATHHHSPYTAYHSINTIIGKRPSLLSAINLCAQCDRPCSAVLSLHAPSICPSVRPSVCRVLLSGFVCKLQRRAECRVRGSHRSGPSHYS